MEDTTPNHIPPPISRDTFQAGSMKPHTYSMTAIRDAIIDHLNRSEDELTERQRLALERYKYQGSWNMSQPTSLENLTKFYNFFNDIFFNGILTGYCKIGTYKAFRLIHGEAAQDLEHEDEFAGHGDFWQAIASELELATRGDKGAAHQLFNLPLDLQRQTSLSAALSTGAELPKEPGLSMVLRQWRFDSGGLFEDCERQRAIRTAWRREAEMAVKRYFQIERRNMCLTSGWVEGNKSDY
ncbi:uncharacterized protein LY89DRAFT_721287 [Mollisia scopiformis]|uniref:Uncharacterized protein n=1 Tax=Mollisia scopiformis TaxID=149040 RepID=A0A194WZ45_MOLSC|nr:uncharacterized protein LY89DRAFT_721287 [Mollisia scopiformis]KUJ13228.1 hypothetical protein LY89DRAFT_721287 [Mollisia scopiformis]